MLAVSPVNHSLRFTGRMPQVLVKCRKASRKEDALQRLPSLEWVSGSHVQQLTSSKCGEKMNTGRCQNQ